MWFEQTNQAKISLDIISFMYETIKYSNSKCETNKKTFKTKCQRDGAIERERERKWTNEPEKMNSNEVMICVNILSANLRNAKYKSKHKLVPPGIPEMMCVPLNPWHANSYSNNKSKNCIQTYVHIPPKCRTHNEYGSRVGKINCKVLT